jgi:hypothetical protein
MTTCIELAAFKYPSRACHELVAERPAMIRALKQRFPGLRQAYLAREDDGAWLDIILWSSRQEALQAAQQVGSIPECSNWFRHITESLGLRDVDVAHVYQA